jgi:aminopeptidase N
MSSPAATPNPGHGAPYGTDPGFPTMGNGGYTVTGYDLDIDYRVGSERLEGTVVITATATQKLSRLTLDLSGLIASKVAVNGSRAAKFSQTDGKLVIRPSRPLAAEQSFTVMVQYGGFPHTHSEYPATGWISSADAVTVVASPVGSSSWFPCNDQPGEAVPVRLRISCDSSHRVTAPGNALSPSQRGNRTIWVFDTRDSLPLANLIVEISRN